MQGMVKPRTLPRFERRIIPIIFLASRLVGQIDQGTTPFRPTLIVVVM